MADFNPYASQQAAIARQQKMADILQQQAFQPQEAGSYNGIPAALPAWGGLAKALQGYMGGLQSKRADESAAKLNTQQGVDTSAAYDYLKQLSLGDLSAVPPKVVPPGMAAALTQAQINAGQLAQYNKNPTGQPPVTPTASTPNELPTDVSRVAQNAAPQVVAQPPVSAAFAPPKTSEELLEAFKAANENATQLERLALANPNYSKSAQIARAQAELLYKAVIDKNIISASDEAQLRETARHNQAGDKRDELAAYQNAVKIYDEIGVWTGRPGTSAPAGAVGSAARKASIMQAQIPFVQKNLDNKESDAKAAAGRWQDLQRIKDLAATSPQGTLAPFTVALGNALSSFNINGDVRALVAGSLTQQAVSNILEGMMKQLGARGLTDNDMAILKDNLPKLGQSAAARVAVADVLQKADYNTMKDYDATLSQYMEQMPNLVRIKPNWLGLFNNGAFEPAKPKKLTYYPDEKMWKFD